VPNNQVNWKIIGAMVSIGARVSIANIYLLSSFTVCCNQYAN